VMSGVAGRMAMAEWSPGDRGGRRWLNGRQVVVEVLVVLWCSCGRMVLVWWSYGGRLSPRGPAANAATENAAA